MRLTTKPGTSAHVIGCLRIAWAKVTAAPATVAADQTTVEVELTAAPEADAAKAEATVTGKVNAVVAAVKVSIQIDK